MKKEKEKEKFDLIILSLFGIFFVLMLLNFASAVPDGVIINSTSNETMVTGAGTMFNISGGYLSKLNLTASSQNPHWKAFLGWVNGEFVLEDSSGSKIYDWTLSSISGSIYATRNSSVANWSAIACANSTYLEEENSFLEHSSTDDNITATFNGGSAGTHPPFKVGTEQIGANSCPALNTFVNNATQSDDFFEMALYDGMNIIYSTIINKDTEGYDGSDYDFQMIVPENGNSTWTGATAYYIYVELV